MTEQTSYLDEIKATILAIEKFHFRGMFTKTHGDLAKARSVRKGEHGIIQFTVNLESAYDSHETAMSHAPQLVSKLTAQDIEAIQEAPKGWPAGADFGYRCYLRINVDDSLDSLTKLKAFLRNNVKDVAAKALDTALHAVSLTLEFLGPSEAMLVKQEILAENGLSLSPRTKETPPPCRT